MTPFVWMFLSSYERLRIKLISEKSITSLVQPQYHTFFESAAVPICIFTIDNSGIESIGSYFDLTDEYGAEIQPVRLLHAIRNPSVNYRYIMDCHEFGSIPGSPIGYWASSKIRAIFASARLLGDVFDVRQGLATSDNGKFMRLWSEVSVAKISFNSSSSEDANCSQKRWFPHSKGGGFRKWYGNREWVVDWKDNGHAIKENILKSYPYLKTPDFVAKNQQFYFKPSVSWTLISSATTAFRYEPVGNIMGHKGPGIFGSEIALEQVIALLNSKLSKIFLEILAPTIGFEVGQVSKIPVLSVGALSKEAVQIAKLDWNCSETSWDFKKLPWIAFPKHASIAESSLLEKSWENWLECTRDRARRMKDIEEENNRVCIQAYDLQDEISPEVSEEEITLARADRAKDCQGLISYVIGCMMGRYSLDEPGLIYALAGNVGFDATRYITFPSDADGIVPISDELWFEDDATNRVREFLNVIWGAENLEKNMEWLAESLGKKGTETPEETIRRYLSGSFYKDHLQTYKKRPIYWHFSSGKQGAFQALVYLHRYQEGTLARMRAEYVVPLTGKMQSRIEMLEKDRDAPAQPPRAPRSPNRSSR
jgi:hypothetical protein